MAKRGRESAVGCGASFTATSSSQRQHRKPNKKQKEECNAITAAVPADIVGDVLKRMNPREAVRLSSVCRYWRAPALTCNPTLGPTPWIVELTKSENRLHIRLQSLTDASVFVKLNPVNFSPGTAWWLENSWHGWLLLSHRPTTVALFFLLNPFSRVRIDLPPWSNSYRVIHITSDPAASGCAVIAHDSDKFMVCRPGDGRWAVGDPVCLINEFSLAVWLDDQLLVLDPIKKRLLTLRLFPLRCKNSVPVSLPENLRCLCYLVESQRDLLLLGFEFRHTRPFVNKSCELIRVFRLDRNSMAFVAVESLGADRVVFLGRFGQSISVSALEVGCAADCIYFQDIAGFVSKDAYSWHCYNLKERMVESVPHPRIPKFCKLGRYLWITPSVKNNCSQGELVNKSISLGEEAFQPFSRALTLSHVLWVEDTFQLNI